MPRVDLKVPYAEKDEAKAQGAKFDGERKVWYVPDGVDASPFAKWIERKKTQVAGAKAGPTPRPRKRRPRGPRP